MAVLFASSPHMHNKRSTSEIMNWLMICATPGLIAQSYFFGFGTIIQLLFAMLVAISLEAIIMLLRKRSPITALQDKSAMVTAWLLAVAIPPTSPWWIICIGLIFAIVIAKHLYGGLGQNLFNPAMVAYVVLLISFPVQMTSWVSPNAINLNFTSLSNVFSLIFYGYNNEGLSLQQIRISIDGVTMATPLGAVKMGLQTGQDFLTIIQQAQFNGAIGIGWGWVNLAYLTGGLFLIKLRIIDWSIPVALLVGLFLPSLSLTLLTPELTISWLLLQLFSGATMLGAFFIATDPVTASTTVRGRLIYGALIGGIIFTIRYWGSFPDGVAFAVLLTNLTVPLIDYYTRPRTYGH